MVSDPARGRLIALSAVRTLPVAGALLGVVLIGRATANGPRLLGVALIAAALAVLATVPQRLARQWRTPR